GRVRHADPRDRRRHCHYRRPRGRLRQPDRATSRQRHPDALWPFVEVRKGTARRAAQPPGRNHRFRRRDRFGNRPASALRIHRERPADESAAQGRRRGRADPVEPEGGVRQRARPTAGGAPAPGARARGDAVTRRRDRRGPRLTSPLQSVELYPAVDIEGGRVARAHGSLTDPLEALAEFTRAGARWIHLVDMDRAYGRTDNHELIEAVLLAARVRVQVGGGLSTEIDLDHMFTLGATR